MNECLTWAALSDKTAVGDSLSAEERLFMRSHRSQCAICASEASLWDDLEKVLEEPERLTFKSNAPRPQPSRRRLRRFGFGSPRWRGALIAVVAATSAVAAVAAFTWGGASHSSSKAPLLVASGSRHPSPLVAAAAANGPRLALAAGEARVNQRAAVAGERLSTGAVVSVAAGEACLLVPPGVTVCVDEGTELSIETLEAGKRRFRLHKGQAVAHLEAQPTGSSFGFETPAGSVVAKGTVFSLRTDGSTVSLRVHEGVVLNDSGTRTSSYRAPSAALLSPERDSSEFGDGATSDARLVELAKYFTDRSQAALVVTAAAGSGVSLGDFQLGVAPISALIQPGQYRMEVSRAGFVPLIEHLALEPGSRVARAYEATAELSSPLGSGTGKPPRGTAPESATTLLERARELRAAGRYTGAGAAYQRLLREHAGSAEARVALVSLGELQLSQLGDAAGALRSFDGYLRAGGPLQQEASYGRIRALRRLGRLSEARAAAGAFLRTYPQSVQAAALKKDLP
jgi:hypothetical protein